MFKKSTTLPAIAALAISLAHLPIGETEGADLGLDNRSDLALTIYGNGLGLVSDRRWSVLKQGINELSVIGMSPKMIPDSLVTASDDGVRVVSREHHAAGPNQHTILKAAVGKAGYLIRVHPATGADVHQPATLLSVEGGIVARIDGRIVLNPEGRWAFDRLPVTLRPNPTLMLGVVSDEPGRRDLELRYLTDGLKWRAVHTADWQMEDGVLHLNSWAVIDNLTGVSFDQAWLKLVAGKVHRVSRPQLARAPRAMKAEAALMSADASIPRREALSGYHLYRLPQAVTLGDGASRQVALMPEIRVKAERQLVSEGFPQAFGVARGPREATHPVIRLSFENPKGQAAQPLPGGTIRLYGRDSQATAQFLGEDRLNDTPVGEKARINAGRAFDVTVARTQIAF